MLPFLWYLLKVIICSGILFGYYWLFLRNKIFHRYNRFYLLTAMGLSLLLPLFKINFWQQSAETNGAIRVLRAVSVGDEYMNTVLVPVQKSFWTLENFYPLVYGLVSLVFAVLLIRTLYIIHTLLKRYPSQQVEEVTFVSTDDDSTPFSFLKFIFWNNSININTATGRQIFKHEVAHIQEKHTYDKLFVNILLIFCWCNPFFWMYRKELNMIHEFIADKKAVEDGDTTAFANMILQTAYPKHRFELTNNFFYSPIKRRLLMLTKIKNPRVSYFARVMVLPLAILVFAAFTFKAKTNSSFYNGKKITVVIDAGHGGDDLGGMAEDGTYEKELTLAIAKKIKELNENKAIEIILTKETDTRINVRNIPTFVKEKNAVLYISVHVDKTPISDSKSGINFYVARDEFENAAQSKILASALINEFTGNYPIPVSSSPRQRNLSIWTLQNNQVPSVLIEAGYLSNKTDLAYLKSEKGKETIAKNVLAAIEKYLTSNTINLPTTIKDTVPTIAPSDMATLAVSNDVDTLDYYKKYGKASHYKGQKIKSVFIRDTDSKAVVIFVTGNMLVMSQEDVFKNNILSTPPPPPPPPPGFYPNDVRPDSFRNKTLIVVDGIIKSDNYVMDNNNIQSVNVLKGNAAVIKYGEKGKNGVVEITTKNAKNTIETDNSVGYNIVDIPMTQEPRAFLGRFGGGKISIDDLKAQKEMRVTQGYSFVSANVYFSHPGSDKVVMLSLNSKLLSSMQDQIDRCVNGSTLMFDNISILDKDGNKKLILNPPGFSVFDKEQLKNVDAAVIQAIQEEREKQNNDNNIIFTKTEVVPQFIGGKDEWLKFLRANLKVTTPVDNGAGAGKYSIVVSFIIHTDGSVSDVKFEKDPGFGTGDEAVRLIKTTSGKWTPAIQNGRKVNAYHKQSITFLVED